MGHEAQTISLARYNQLESAQPLQLFGKYLESSELGSQLECGTLDGQLLDFNGFYGVMGEPRSRTAQGIY